MSRINALLRELDNNEEDIQQLNQLVNPQRLKKDIPASFEVSEPDQEHMMDILFLPRDNGYRYALVITDVGNKEFDAEPLKSKSADEVLKAIKKIYRRRFLRPPKYQIDTDDGAEFKGPVHRYFVDTLKVTHRTALPNRHSQQGPVESLNRTLGSVLNKNMAIQEMKTGEDNTSWVRPLKRIIPTLNRKRRKRMDDPYAFPKIKDVPPSMRSDALPIGTRVRRLLDGPEDAQGRRLHGNFREGDRRFEQLIREIEKVYIHPNQPIRYKLSGMGNNVSFTRNQLKLVPAAERPALPEGTYEVEKLLKKRTHKGKVQYLVKWKGYPTDQSTWEYYQNLKQDLGTNILNRLIRNLRE